MNTPTGLTSDLIAGAADEHVTRRLSAGPDPSAQAARFETLVARPIPGVVQVVRVRPTQGALEVVEAAFSGRSLGGVLEAAHDHITTAVALTLVRDAALSLARLHDLDRAAPPLHGALNLRELYLTPAGEVRIGGARCSAGNVQDDVKALLAALRDLLRPKANKPGGAQLLARLSSLRFDSAHELHRTIDAHLSKQPQDRLQAARVRFATSVMDAAGGAERCPRGVVAATPSEPIALGDTRPEVGRSALSATQREERLSTEPSTLAYAADLPIEAPEIAEEATVQTGDHAELQAALRTAFRADEEPPGSSESAPFSILTPPSPRIRPARVSGAPMRIPRRLSPPHSSTSISTGSPRPRRTSSRTRKVPSGESPVCPRNGRPTSLPLRERRPLDPPRDPQGRGPVARPPTSERWRRLATR